MTADEKQALIARNQARLEAAIPPTQGSGSAHRDSPPPIAIKPPNWGYWRHMPTVAPWEACALALNIEPESLDYRAGSFYGEREVWRAFPSGEIGEHFIKLLRLLNKNQFERKHFTTNFAMGVRLSEFAAWCAPVVHSLIGGDIPPELAALSKAAHEAAANVEAGAVTSLSGDVMPWLVANPTDPAPDYPWYTPARYFARQLVKDDSTLRVKRKKLAEKTAKSLADAGVFARGKKNKPLSAGTVLKSFVNVILN